MIRRWIIKLFKPYIIEIIEENRGKFIEGFCNLK